jgi:hypothetical protein
VCLRHSWSRDRRHGSRFDAPLTIGSL